MPLEDPQEKPGSAPVVRIHGAQIESIRKVLITAVGRVCPTWLAREREDLVQSALLRIVTLLGNEEPLREVNATYLWKTAYSVTLDEIRRARWRFERAAEGDALSGHRSETSADPERAASGREICVYVRGCLRQLEPSRRRAVIMRLAGYSHEEAAHRLGMRLKQVANFIHRGMQDLRRCLRAKGVTA